MPTNDPLKKFDDVVENQAQKDNDNIQQAQDDTVNILEENRREIERHDEIQENNASHFDSNTYTDR